jgi:hypothetical protein
MHTFLAMHMGLALKLRHKFVKKFFEPFKGPRFKSQKRLPPYR